MNRIPSEGSLRITILLIWLLVLTSCAPAAAPAPTTIPSPVVTNTLPPPATATQPPEASPTALPTETAIPSATKEISPTTVPTKFFQFYKKNPVLPAGTDPNWDNTFIDPGATFYYQGQFHMFFNGINGFPRPVGVGYATSPDGYQWTRQVTQPVFGALDLDPQGEFHGQNLFVTSGLVLEDGTWVLYYYTLNSSTFSGPQTIGRATAPGPKGPWTADPDPVLEPGPEGAWDEIQVSSPDVLKTPDGYLMYYDGMGRRSMIGMATSPDGIHWSKYDDPSTKDNAFIESDPVLVNDEGTWDAGRVMDPNVVQTDQGYVMLYLSTDGLIKFGNSTYAIGYATSQDGIHWKKGKENPVLSSQDNPYWGQTFLVTLVHEEDTYFLYFDFKAVNIRGTNVFLATHKGTIGIP
ncbi:MAG: hypothetical protein P8Z00_15475 [Anaerolineales bacterium]|jgi:predicted GH43/DUF377 family glycosyl hydrolase